MGRWDTLTGHATEGEDDVTSRLFAVVCVAVVAVFTASCAAPEPVSTGPPAASPTTEARAPAVSRPPAGPRPFGSTFEWPDGVKVTLGEPKPFTASDAATAVQTGRAPRGRVVVFDVALFNGTTAPIVPYGLATRGTSGTVEASEVVDYGPADVGTPSAPIQPGKTLKWRVAYEKPGGDLVVTVVWNYEDGNPATYKTGG